MPKKPSTTSSSTLLSLKAHSATELPSVVLDAAAAARSKGKQIVLATGVFDILHHEHELFLRKAREAGHILIVGLEPDARVTATKGPNRPVHSEFKRLENLLRLRIADVVFVLPDQFSTPEERKNFIHTLRPTILAVSANSPHLENKQQLMAEVGGEVRVVHEHNPAISTTILVEKLAKMKS